MLFGKKQQAISELDKKREAFTENIRRTNRQEIFSKRRNIEEKNPQTPQNIDVQQRRKNYILDSRYEVQIQKFLKNRYHIETLPELVKAIYDPDIIKQHYGIIGVRKIMSISDQPPIQDIIDVGLVPKMIEYVKQEEYPQLQLQATWALTNVASGNISQCQSIVDKGGIPLFIKLLRSSCQGIVQQAIWAIGNIASDCSIHRDAIIKQGGIQNMIYAIQNTNLSHLVSQGCWALSNLCRGKPMPRYEYIKEALPILSMKIVGGWVHDQETLSDCIWGICHNMHESIHEMLFATNFHKKIPELLSTKQISIVVPALRILGSMTKSIAHLPQIIKEDNLMSHLSQLLTFANKVVRTQVAWVLGNIAGGSIHEVNFLFTHEKIIGQVLQLLDSDVSSVRIEITELIVNLTHSGKPEMIYQFYQQINIVKIFLDNMRNDDPKLVKISIESLYTILQFGEGFKSGDANPFVDQIFKQNGEKVLEQLQLHKEKAIYDQVIRIVSDFFTIDESLNI